MSSEIKQDPDGVQGFQTVWEYGLDQGIGIGCYQLDADGKIGKLVGANMLFVMTDGTAEDFAKLKVKNRCQFIGPKLPQT